MPDDNRESKRSFKDAGFLADEIETYRHAICKSNSLWFDHARKVNFSLQCLVNDTSFSPKKPLEARSIGVSLLLRTLSSFQTAVLLIERGATSQALTLARACLEDGFVMSALLKDADDLIDRLKKDYNASRKGQLKSFIAASWADASTVEEYKQILQELGPGRLINFSDLSDPRDTRYLMYRLLSGHAVHCSADSLQRSMAIEGGKWVAYRFGPDDPERIPSALRYACLAALPVGVEFAELFGDIAKRDQINSLIDQTLSKDVPIDWFVYPSED